MALGLDQAANGRASCLPWCVLCVRSFVRAGLLAGLSRYSVLDKLVPAYYHRLEDDGSICGSAFGANNAREPVSVASSARKLEPAGQHQMVASSCPGNKRPQLWPLLMARPPPVLLQETHGWHVGDDCACRSGARDDGTARHRRSAALGAHIQGAPRQDRQYN